MREAAGVSSTRRDGVRPVNRIATRNPGGAVDLPEGWLVQAIPSGLLVTTSDGPRPSLAGVSLDPDRHDLVVAAPGPLPTPVVAAIARLARSLPETVQARLRVVAMGATDPRPLADLAGALRLPFVQLSQRPTADVPAVAATPPPTARTTTTRTTTARTTTARTTTTQTTPARPTTARHTAARLAMVPVTSAATMPAPEPAPATMTAFGARVDFAVGADGRIRLRPGGTGQSRPASPVVQPESQPAPPFPPPATKCTPAGVPGVDRLPVAEPLPAIAQASAVPAMPDASDVPAGPRAPAARPRADRAPVGPVRWHSHSSSAEDRRQLRASLGWRYDAAAQYVARLLSDRPGLRAPGDEALAADLAAVQFFASSGDDDLLQTVRAAAGEGNDLPLLSCLVSGLRRLPTLVGPVVRGGLADLNVRPGTTLVEPGPMLALTDPAVAFGGAPEVLIWSTSARQLQGLIDPASAAAAMFLPGTGFRVIEHDTDREPARLLMVEVAARTDPVREARIAEQLRTVAAARAATALTSHGPPLGWPAAWLAPVPGRAPAPGSASPA